MDRKIVKLQGNVGVLNAGEIAGFPAEEADDLVRRGLAVELDKDGNPIEPEATDEETDGRGGEPDFSSMSKEKLVGLAEERGIAVTRAEGEGEPLKSDYVRALTEADEGADADGGESEGDNEGGDDDTDQSDEPSS